MKRGYSSIIDRIAHWGNIVITLFVILEVIFFYSLPNIAGCAMTIVCWWIYRSIGLKESVIERHIFPWLVFTSMSLYRILPLIATFSELKPIAYKFEMPYETFFGETFLYIISSLAFYFAIYRSKPRPNAIQNVLKRFDFYKEPSEALIWALGFVGLLARLYLMFVSGGVEIGDVGGKFTAGFTYLDVAPILLLFPTLYKQKTACNKIIIRHNLSLAYLLLLIVISFATNSRYAILIPIGTFVLLFILSLIKTKTDYRQFISFKGVFAFIIAVLVILPALTDISDAMLVTRNIRSNISKSELFEETWRLFNDKEQLKNIRAAKEQIVKASDYSEGWSEEYVDNFALNRYCNMRITDMAMYHASRVGYADERMIHAFGDRVLSLLPTPVLNFLGLNIDKVNIFSRGDLLYSISTNTAIHPMLRVTSHLADGLVTFGYWYFPIQFILFYLQFLLLNCFLITSGRQTIYSTLGLITVFSFLAMFRNANGCVGEVQYIIRKFVESVFIYILCSKLTQPFIRAKIRD